MSKSIWPNMTKNMLRERWKETSVHPLINPAIRMEQEGAQVEREGAVIKDEAEAEAKLALPTMVPQNLILRHITLCR